jgi:hypothetical protein
MSTMTDAQQPQQVWTLPTRIAFRFAFCYVLLYALCCGNATVWKTLPWIGDRLELLFWWPFKHAAPWFGRHIFHLTGSSARLHVGVSNDQALTWISVGVMFALAIIATTIWSIADHQTKAYPKLLLWFRFALRICIGSSMLLYGMLKLFPNQMAPPSLAVLNEPLGNTSPMTLLWTLVGLHPIYEIIGGAVELTCGILVLFRRTALLGALATVAVISNVVLYNYFFDVPVKIFSAHLLLMALIVILPDSQALISFFWRHAPTSPQTGWSPWSTPGSMARETRIIATWLLIALAWQVHRLAPITAQEHANIAHPQPLTGIWQVESATRPYLTADGLPMTAMSLEPNGRAMLRASDNALWRAVAKYDGNKHTLQIQPIGLSEPITYTFSQPDTTHLILTPTQPDAGTLTLSKIPTPASYPLLDRGFHWINEWGLER